MDAAKLKEELQKCTDKRKALENLARPLIILCVCRDKLLQSTTHMRETVHDLEEHLKNETGNSNNIISASGRRAVFIIQTAY